MSFFGLRTGVSTITDAIKSVQPIALVHHGGATARLFAQGKHRQVHDFVKAVHDGVIVGGFPRYVDEIKFHVDAVRCYAQVLKADQTS